MGRVEHVQADPAIAERAAQHLRAEAGAAHAQQDRVRDAGVLDLRAEGAEIVALGGQALRDVQPAEPVRELRRALRGPQRAVALPQAAHDLFPGRGLQPLGDRRLEAGGKLGLDRHGPGLTRVSTALRRPASGRKGSGASGRRDLPM